jgi:co-chaperonin GroES (HSP10)
MKIKAISPREGYFVTKQYPQTRKQDKTNFEVEENTDDFTVFAEVVHANPKKLSTISKGDNIIFQPLEAQPFRDGDEVYYFIKEKYVLGTYKD